MFAKRHYEAIAKTMQQVGTGLSPDGGNPAFYQWQDTVRYLADMFTADNANFKRVRFTQACQPGANVRARNASGCFKHRPNVRSIPFES